MNFTESDIKKLQELTDLYLIAKSLILYSEEWDEDQKIVIQILKEQRDAGDHIFKALVNKRKGDNEGDNFAKNIDKAMGHTYRAAFDALDIASLTFKEKIAKTLNPYRTDTILKIIPDCGDINNEIEDICSKIAEHRSKKDVNIEILSTAFNSYFNDIKKLRQIYKKINNSLPSIHKAHKESKRDKIINFLIALIIGVTLATFGFFLGRLNQTQNTPANIKTEVLQEQISPSDSIRIK